MINRNNFTSESGYTNSFALAVTAVVACVGLAMGAVGVLASATPGASTEITAVYDSPTAYFPAQYVNQATEIEPMPPTF
jgi:hypothetical protein